MKLGKLRETYYAATRRVTEITQTSSLGGLGAIWLLRPPSTGAILPADLLWPLVAFVLALALDLAQFVWRTAAFAVLANIRYRQSTIQPGTDEGEVDVGPIPAFINVVSWGFFTFKVAAMILGFALLAHFVYQQV